MTDSPDVILELFSGKSRVQLIAGTFRGLDGLRAIVDFDGGRVPAHPATAYTPELNEAVWIAIVDGVAWMLGPSVMKPGEGSFVSEDGGGVATVSTTIGDVQATFNAGATFTAGEQVKLYWNQGCHILGVKSTAVDEPDVPDVPVGGANRITTVFSAIDSGSYQPGFGWRINDVWSSASNIGAWFYGTKIRDTIPDNAVIVAAEIYLPLLRETGAFPFGRHTAASKPGGPVTILATSTLPGRSGWVAIPTSLIDELKVNVGGLGFDEGGWNIWAGTQKDGQSGAVRITYDT